MVPIVNKYEKYSFNHLYYFDKFELTSLYLQAENTLCLSIFNKKITFLWTLVEILIVNNFFLGNPSKFLNISKFLGSTSILLGKANCQAQFQLLSKSTPSSGWLGLRAFCQVQFQLLPKNDYFNLFLQHPFLVNLISIKEKIFNLRHPHWAALKTKDQKNFWGYHFSMMTPFIFFKQKFKGCIAVRVQYSFFTPPFHCEPSK